MKASLASFFQSVDSLDEMLNCIFSAIDAAVIIADKNRHMLLVNKAAQELYGYEESELIGQSTKMLYAKQGEFEQQGKQYFNANIDRSLSLNARLVDYQRKDGAHFIGETLGGPIAEAGQDTVFYIGIIKDVTKRLASETALNRLHAITSDRALDFQQRVLKILHLGSELFQLPIGIFSRIEGDQYEVVEAIHPSNALTSGMIFSLAKTYCVHTLQANGPVGFHHAGSSEIHDHPCYENFALEAYLGSPILVDGECFGTLNFSSPVPCQPFTQQDTELVRLFAQWLGHEIARNNDLDALQEAKQALQRQATTDALTGLYNRRYAEQRLSEELDRYKRYEGDLSLALLDFDHFKALNDQYGHAAGDQALLLFAQLAGDIFRDSDIIARWGGEEFLIILPETNAEQAKRVLQRLQLALKTSPLQLADETVTVTLSLGLACVAVNDDIETFIQRADQAMYKAKSLGRNQIYQL